MECKLELPQTLKNPWDVACTLEMSSYHHYSLQKLINKFKRLTWTSIHRILTQKSAWAITKNTWAWRLKPEESLTKTKTPTPSPVVLHWKVKLNKFQEEDQSALQCTATVLQLKSPHQLSRLLLSPFHSIELFNWHHI